MLRQDALISKIRSELDIFLQPMLAAADRPRQKFLRQSVRAILLSGGLVVSELARWIRDDCSDLFYRVKRLLNHLTCRRGDLTRITQAYRCQMASQIQHDTPIIIDMTDLAKPRARHMEYLAYVRDGSTGQLVPGYWCFEVYAHLSKKRIVPLALEVFSVDDPAVDSQNAQVFRTLQSVNQALNGKGVYVADRGFDGLQTYETCFSLKCHFVVRQRGDRMVVTTSGVRIVLRDLVERLQHQQAQAGGLSGLVFCPIRLPERSEVLYVVASWRNGSDEPLMLLTNLAVSHLQQARQILWYYQRRWACEEAGRFLKSRVGLERFCIRRYQAIQRLVTLAMFAMGFLTWLSLKPTQLIHNLWHYTSRFRKNSPFIYYRLLDSLQNLALLQPQTCLQPHPPP